jgi:hypothetical protein
MEQTTEFSTKPLYRPDQLQTAKEEIRSLESKLSNPLIQDKGEVGKQLRRAKHITAMQTPEPPATVEEEGRMVARSKSLLSDILQGMPSHEEMRKSPPGAIDKHRHWEGRNKAKILEWKNLQLRLTAGSGDREVANLERHRPHASTLNMDNAFIAGKNFFMPDTAGPAVVFSDAQLAVLRKMSPQLADAIGMMTNPQREEVKNAISGIGLAQEPSPASVAGKKGIAKKRTMSAKHKAAMAAGRAAAAKRNAEKKAA